MLAMDLMHLACAWLIVAAVTPTSRLSAADSDLDGLDDSTEQTLLDRHRPILVFENDERHWPISAERFVRGSRLRWNTHPDRAFDYAWLRDVYSETQLGLDPSLILRGDEARPGEPSDVGEHPDRNEWYLDLNDALRGGVYPGPTGAAHEGMYGHATPLADGSILLQYWQLFPFNEAECVSDCGDHEGDWTWLDLYLDGMPPYTLRQIVYHHHGDRNCPPTSLPSASIPLPADGVPVCYLEEQAHEWWPWASGGEECDFDPTGLGLCPNASHHGNGISYRVSHVENLGERNAPARGSLAAELILHYNGRWGGWGAECFDHHFEPPDSPVHQGYALPGSLPGAAVHVDFGYTGREFGTAAQPFNTLAEAVSAVIPWRTILLRSGNSGERLTITKPCNLLSEGGTVIIGQ